MIDFDYPVGATPIDPNEMGGLIPIHINNQTELNEFEQFNILKAEQWVMRKKLKLEEILEQAFMRILHQRMFNETWRWAGKFRQTEKNIGVDPLIISTELKKLNDDVLFHFENGTYSLDEIVTRFHHRLVLIHPFANGNGRYARLISDVILKTLDRPLFSWGSINLSDHSKTRAEYISALRAADKYDYQRLIEFVRS